MSQQVPTPTTGDAAGKPCLQCGRPLPPGQFNGSGRSPDGLASTCRPCVNAARRARYLRNRSCGPADARKALMRAAKKGDLAGVQQLLQATPNSAGVSRALITAAKQGHPGIVALLLPAIGESGAAIAGALHAAIAPLQTVRKTPGHRACVDGLLAHVEHPTERGRMAGSLLCLAAEAGCGEMGEALLHHGAQLDLFSAAALGRIDHVRALLAADRALVSATDARGRTALHHCARSALGKPSPDVAARLHKVTGLLIAHGVDVSAADAWHPEAPWRETPLMAAAGHGGSADIVRLLLDGGADPSADDSHALWFALGHYQRHGKGHYSIAAILLAHGVDVNAKRGGRTLLHALAHHSDARGVKWLLHHVADVNANTDDGRTPLHLAAERNVGVEVVRLLLEHGAGINARDGSGATPLAYAELNEKRKIAAFLRQRGATE